MRVNRQIEIIIKLLNRNVIPAKDFAEQFHVSTRTIYRDVEDLSSAGIPVYMSKGTGGGISLLDTFTFDKTLLTSHESESLILALRTLQATQYPEIEQTLSKLGALFHNSQAEEWVEIHFSPWGSKPNDENKFINIKRAILSQKAVDFDYTDVYENRCRRQVEPLRIIFKDHSWYLWGFCRTREDFRTFRLSRIKDLEITQETFTRRKIESDESEDHQSEPKILTKITLLFSKDIIHRVYDDFSDELIQRKPDGSCQVTINFVVDEWVYGFILSYGCFVEVLEPESLRKTIYDRLVRALEKYQTA